MEKLWFKAKRYGWGWYPSTWEGWLVTIIAVGIITLNSSFIKETPDMMESGVVRAVVLNIATAIALIFIAWKKGEKPKWRWGGK